VEPEDISPEATESQQGASPPTPTQPSSPEAIESQSLQKDAPPSTAVQPGELNSEDKTMEKAEKGIFENTAELGRNLFSLDGAKTLATLYIETTEKLAEGVLNFQAAATECSKDTPFAVVLEAQHSMARKLVEFSTGTARRLWRIEASKRFNVDRIHGARGG
jgi:hypothetical protein